jgi:hypothetical protein
MNVFATGAQIQIIAVTILQGIPGLEARTCDSYDHSVADKNDLRQGHEAELQKMTGKRLDDEGTR